MSGSASTLNLLEETRLEPHVMRCEAVGRPAALSPKLSKRARRLFTREDDREARLAAARRRGELPALHGVLDAGIEPGERIARSLRPRHRARTADDDMHIDTEALRDRHPADGPLITLLKRRLVLADHARNRRRVEPARGACGRAPRLGRADGAGRRARAANLRGAPRIAKALKHPALFGRERAHLARRRSGAPARCSRGRARRP